MDNIIKAAAALGRKGGAAKSERKSHSSAANGALGGRPAAWEASARKRGGYIFLQLEVARDESGKTWRTSKTLWLEAGGGIRIEERRELATVQIGWREKKTGKEYPIDYLDVVGYLASAKLRSEYTTVNRTLTDSEVAQHNAEAAKVIGVLSDWPSELYIGTVRLAGSQDRWVAAIGAGGHEDNLPGAYATAEEASSALEHIIQQRQAKASQIIVKRCAPNEVRCVFPAINITVIGDEAVKAQTLGNRAARRSHLQR